MKRTYIFKATIQLSFFCILALLFSCNTTKSKASTEPTTPPDPYMTFETPVHDFGIIKKGESKTHVFKFTNTGKEPITVELVSGCDCTDLEWPEGETFQPGEGGNIKATFHSSREEDWGPMEKVIDILLTNINPETGYQIIKEAKYKLVLEK